MDETPKSPGVQWSTSPSAKTRNAVQRSVTALLDALAPERVLTRVGVVPGRVEQHRTPTGCVLQAADCAVSVSWFVDTGGSPALGELHVLVWRGKLARRGMVRAPKQATMLSELVLTPIEPPTDECVWKAADGTRYNTETLASYCLDLLEREIGRGQ